MNYEILSRSDLSTGATLVVRIPEEELDEKALYTVLADPPGFILPFRYKNVDGDMEFTYLIGGRNKLSYSYGSREPREYAALWTGVLNPLLECDDWFMNPFSFVLHADYLYYDRASGTVCYVYIPAKTPGSDVEMLRAMAMELSKKCPSGNAELEIKALRAIMQDFNPRQFLQMLKPWQNANATSAGVTSADVTPADGGAPAVTGGGAAGRAADRPAGGIGHEAGAVAGAVGGAVSAERAAPSPDAGKKAAGATPTDGDIVINLGGGRAEKEPRQEKVKKPEKAPAKSGGFGGLLGGGKTNKGAQKADQAPQKGGGNLLGGLFGKKKAESREMLMGAAAEPDGDAQRAGGRIAPEHDAGHAYGGDTEDGVTKFEDDGVTSFETSVVRFRYTGTLPLPPEIRIGAAPGKPYIIGRFDVTVGRRQSDFEFDKSTRGVSRRHAAIEYTDQGYVIIDLSSSAGTYVNGQRLVPNVPRELVTGVRVSFGLDGADYVYEG